MNSDDIKVLSKKTRDDGKRLFGVCETLYDIATICNVLTFIIGAILSIFIGTTFNILFGGIVAFLTIVFCVIMYMIAVLMTHYGKVLVHTSFSSVGILEHLVSSDVRTNQSDIDIAEPTLSAKLNVSLKPGQQRLMVTSIKENSQAWRSGVRHQDVIFSYSNMEILTIKALKQLAVKTGNSVTELVVLRDGKTQNLTVRDLIDELFEKKLELTEFKVGA